MFNRERGFNGGGVVRKGKPFLFLFQRVKKYYGRGGGFIKPIVGTLGENVDFSQHYSFKTKYVTVLNRYPF